MVHVFMYVEAERQCEALTGLLMNPVESKGRLKTLSCLIYLASCTQTSLELNPLADYL